jgi:hypothetical protein
MVVLRRPVSDPTASANEAKERPRSQLGIGSPFQPRVALERCAGTFVEELDP